MTQIELTSLSDSVPVSHPKDFGAGVEAIAHTMSVSSDTLEDEVEPFLLRSEYVIRTQRGRCATSKAYEMLKLFNPNKDSGSQKP